VSLVNADSDYRVRNVKNALREQLENLFEDTSRDCSVNISRLDDGDYRTELRFITDTSEKWRKESLRWITWGFRKLYAVVSLGDAENGVWEVVDEVFRWKADKTSPVKFKFWQSLATRSSPLGAGGLSIVSPKYSHLGDMADQLNAIFRADFEKRLIRLRNEAILAEKNELDSTVPASTEAASPLPRGLSAPRPSTLELNSKDSRVLGIARAKLVAAALEEVSYVRPALRSRGDVPKLAGEHSDFMMFEVLLRNKYVLEKLGPLIENAEFTKLAIEIAAAKAGRSFSTMQTAYKHFKDYL
jgi:hypothetical protein